ncbi:MAG: hypothetical protein WBG30_14400 [Psychrilyobacter sp.]
MNKKVLIFIGFLMFFTLVLCSNEEIGQGGRMPKVPTNIPNITFEQN